MNDYRDRVSAFLRLLPPDDLALLRRALAEDDDRLGHGYTTHPPEIDGVRDWPCAGACLMAFPRLAAGGTVEQVAEYWRDYFGRLCLAHGLEQARRLMQEWDGDVERHRARALALLACDEETERRKTHAEQRTD